MALRLPVALFLLASASIFAAEGPGRFGLGVSVKPNGGSIYLPMAISTALRLEGTVAYSQWSSTQDIPIPGGSTSRARDASIGIGIFGLKKLANDLNIYYGPRLSHTDYSYTIDSVNSVLDGSTFSRRESRKGNSIAAVVGVEYYAAKSFSIGAEVGLVHQFENGEAIANFPGMNPIPIHSRSTSTVNALVARYYF